MSFILDALKNLEQKRHQSNVPDLLTDHTTEEIKSSKRPLWPYLILAALILNAAILTVLLRPWESDRSGVTEEIIITEREKVTSSEPLTETEQRSPRSPDKTLESAVAASEATNQAPPSETVSAPVKQVATPAAEKPLTDSAEKINGKKQSSGSKTASTKETVSPVPVVDPEEESADRISEALSSQDREEPDETIPSAPPKEEVREETISASGSGITAFNDLPESIRQELPKISISGHIYSNNPSARMVNISGSIVREGEMAAPGLKVEEITDSGVILSYRGHRFSIKGF